MSFDLWIIRKYFSARIIHMKKRDLKLRKRLLESGKLTDGYSHLMEKSHMDNAKFLERIISIIGYPTIQKVGEKANEAAWLVIQHAISRPEFMKKCARLLEKEASENIKYKVQLAYLTDRINMYEGTFQRYGTIFDWDENGIMNPIPYDDIQKVNERRGLLGLNTLEEQTEIMRKQSIAEKIPKDFAAKKKEYEEWRKRVGWV